MFTQFIKFTVGSAAVAVTMAALSFPAAAEPKKTVRDDRTGIVVNTFGNCVRTKWDADQDICAPEKPEPAPAPVAAPAPAPAPVISLEQRTIYFDFDDASLTTDAVAKLETLAGIIRTSPHILGGDIVGYADEMGNSDYNVALSQRRAKAIDEYLSSRVSIPVNVVAVQGLGETNSVTNCEGISSREEKISCLAADRRVEVQFKYQQ